jgi:hypothetical protein
MMLVLISRTESKIRKTPGGFAKDIGVLTQRKFYPDSIQANDAVIDFPN